MNLFNFFSPSPENYWSEYCFNICLRFKFSNIVKTFAGADIPNRRICFGCNAEQDTTLRGPVRFRQHNAIRLGHFGKTAQLTD